MQLPRGDIQLILRMLLNTRFWSSSTTNSFAHQLAQELMGLVRLCLVATLASLNQILSESHLSIQNGRWRGPEHQISLFHFGLFAKGPVWQEMGRSRNQRGKQIATLEEICGASLSSGQKLDWSLWAQASVNKCPANACQFQVIEEKWGYFDNIFYSFAESSVFCWATYPYRNWGWWDDDILLPPSCLCLLHPSSSYYGVYSLVLRVARISLTQLSKKWRKRSCWVIIQRIMSPMNLVSFEAQVYL